jgi:hypothetical protein
MRSLAAMLVIAQKFLAKQCEAGRKKSVGAIIVKRAILFDGIPEIA